MQPRSITSASIPVGDDRSQQGALSPPTARAERWTAAQENEAQGVGMTRAGNAGSGASLVIAPTTSSAEAGADMLLSISAPRRR